MAIDYTGISSIDAGAHDITYSGNQGPKSPDQERQMAFDDTPGFELQPLELLLEEFREDNNGQDPTSIDDLRRFFYNKYGPKGIAKLEQAVQQAEQQAQMQEQREGIQMATAADPMLQDEYDKYVFEMQEMGQEPMSLEEFRQQAVAGMATGGRVRLWNGGPPGGGDPEMTYTAPSSDRGPRDDPDRFGPPDWKEQYTPPDPGGDDKVPGDDALKRYIVDEKAEAEQKEIKEWKEAQGKGKVWDTVKKKFVHPTQKALYHVFGNKPGNEKKYIRYLISQGVNVPKKYLDILEMDDDEDVDFDLFQDLTYEYNPKLAKMPPSEMSKVDYFPMNFESYLASQGNFNILAGGDIGNLANLKNPGTVINPKTGLPFTDFEWDQHKRSSSQWNPGNDDQGIASIPEWQRQGFPSYAAWLAAQGTGTTAAATTAPAIATGSAALPYTVNPNADDLTQGRGGWFYNDGGRVGYAGGGIADLRQGYFLGKIVKKLKRGAKKITKSKLGRAALMAAIGGYGLKGLGGGGWGLSGWSKMGAGIEALKAKALKDEGKNWLGDLLLNKDRTGWSPWKLGIGAASLAPLIMGDDDEEDEGKMYEDWLKEKAKWDATYKAIPTTSLPSPYSRYLMGAADGGRIGYRYGKSYKSKKDDPFNKIMESVKAMVEAGMVRDEREGLKMILEHGSYGVTNEPIKPYKFSPRALEHLRSIVHPSQIKDNPFDKRVPNIDPGFIRPMPEGWETARADGGRIGYQGGGYNDEDEEEDSHRVAALRALYGMRRNAQEGGLMDLGGMEKDYRNEGGFVPIGGQERADDVPARLSKNEFVFTADAVRAAGGGDIDKGAEIMENVMENLEQGGQVSEESQGLEGARNMFATAQRLEGVL